MKRNLKAVLCAVFAAAMLFTAFSCQPKEEHEDDEREESDEKKDKMKDEDEDKDEDEKQDEEQADEDETEQNDIEYVYEYINVVRNVKPDEPSLDFGDEFTSRFSVPQLDVESVNAAEFNEKILELYPDIAFETDFSEEPVPTPCSYSFSYNWDVTDRGVVAIAISKALGFYYSEYYCTNICLYYDLKNDCEATASEYLESAGIDLETVQKEAVKIVYTQMAKGEHYEYAFSEPEFGELAIRSENEGFVMLDVSGYSGFYPIEVPINETEYETAYCTSRTVVYKTPSFDADILKIFDTAQEVSVICKASIQEGNSTYEYDEEYEWYAVKYNDVYGYVYAADLLYGEYENLPTQPVKVDNDAVYEYINVTRNVKPDNKVLDYGDVYTSSFSIPQLSIESRNAERFNEKILEMYPDIAFEAEFSDDPVPTPYISNYSYLSDITDNGIVAIVVRETLGYYASESYTSYTDFYYDLKNDRETTQDEYLDAIGTTRDKVTETAQKAIYIKAAKGELSDCSYDLGVIKDYYPTMGEVVIRSENKGYICVDITGYGGYYLMDIPFDGIEYEKGRCFDSTNLFETPSFDSEIISRLYDDYEINIITKAAIPEGLSTIEYDEENEWYAVEWRGLYGYIAADRLIIEE